MDLFCLVFLTLLGACVGSFLNVVIYRLPRGESLVLPGSHCPHCGRPIRWYDNVPLISWLVLRGKCRDCRAAISPRYLLIEAVTAIAVGGLFALYFILDVRDGAGRFSQAWPMYAAHAALLCGLLVCTLVDIELWIVPLEVCWFVSAVGIAAATFRPHEWMPPVSAPAGAASIAAAAGLAISWMLLKFGVFRPSFVDADDRPQPAPPPPKPQPSRAAGKKSKKHKKPQDRPPAVAFTKAHGVNPRKEILLEVLYLLPALALAAGAWLLVAHVPAAGQAWGRLQEGAFGEHFGGFQAALFGYLVGGAWIWGIRIFGTLGFGKEAMGLGDVHILAAVGAVCGWVAPSIAFFLAPLFGLIWALHLLLSKRQRELPYGPWLALASVAVMIFYDGIVEFLAPLLSAGGLAPGGGAANVPY